MKVKTATFQCTQLSGSIFDNIFYSNPKSGNLIRLFIAVFNVEPFSFMHCAENLFCNGIHLCIQYRFLFIHYKHIVARDLEIQCYKIDC